MPAGGWDFHLVGQVGVCGPVGRIGVGGATQDFPVAGADEAVAFEAVVARVGSVVGIPGADCGGAVGFLPRYEVDAGGVLEVAPHAVVDAHLVPRVEDFAAFGGVVAQGGGGGALDDGNVMGAFFPVIRNAEIEVAEMVAAHVQPEEMAGRVALSRGGGGLGIEGCGVMVVAVGGEDVEAGEFLETGVWIGHGGRHGAAKQLVDGGKVGEAALAPECFEKVTGVDVCLPLVGVVQE